MFTMTSKEEEKENSHTNHGLPQAQKEFRKQFRAEVTDYI